MKKLKRAHYFALALLMFVAGFLTYGYRYSPKVSATVPYVNSRISVDSSGNQANAYTQSDSTVSLSKDGRYVAFSSDASNLVSGDTNGKSDIFVRDRIAGTTVRVDLTSTGAQQTSDYIKSSKISANGRFVVFSTADPNMVPGDTNGVRDTFVRDLQLNTTTIVSVSSAGVFGNQQSPEDFDISADGRYIVFYSLATNLVSGDTNGAADIFVRDTKLGTTTLMSKSDAGVIGNNASLKPSISCDGATVAFLSAASNLTTGDTNGYIDTFVVNRVGSDSVTNITQTGNDGAENFTPTDVSCDGSTVTFLSYASNLVSGDTNAKPDLFAYDVSTQTMDRVNVSTAGAEANFNSYGTSGLSGDGRYVVFTTGATTLVSGDTNNAPDVFLRDRQAGTTEIVSKRNSSTQTSTSSGQADISNDGERIGYISLDSGLVSGDTNSVDDVFVADTGTSICQ